MFLYNFSTLLLQYQVKLMTDMVVVQLFNHILIIFILVCFFHRLCYTGMNLCRYDTKMLIVHYIFKSESEKHKAQSLNSSFRKENPC